MLHPDWQAALSVAHRHSLDFLNGLPDRPVRAANADYRKLMDALGGPIPEGPTDASEVIESLALAAEPGLVATPSGRFFGFVIGGSTPAALAADWLTGVWDQNAGLAVAGPAASAVEEVAGSWLVDILGLPSHVSFGLVTGAQMANFTALAAARHQLLADLGWPVEEAGLFGAPRIRVLAGSSRHDSIDRALRFLGLGTEAVVEIGTDAAGRMRPDDLATELSRNGGPTIVCAQAGGVNGGSVDPLTEICTATHEHGGWVHVDGAFGLWAAASPRLRDQVEGVELADSWTTDAHKMLNVPYDSGLVFCAHPDAHRAAMQVRAAYLVQAEEGGPREALDYNPEFSRRARGFAVYAALRALGRSGVADLVEQRCALAARFASLLAPVEGVEVIQPVTFNQVMVRFHSPDGDHDAHTRRVIQAVQDDGTCWMSGTVWQDRAAMRISVANWSTDESDVDRSVEAIIRCHSAAALA